jgi:hypothetical protein
LFDDYAERTNSLLAGVGMLVSWLEVLVFEFVVTRHSGVVKQIVLFLLVEASGKFIFESHSKEVEFRVVEWANC